MHRRSLLRRGGALLGAGALGSLAGCFGGGSSTPPPRQARVFDDITLDSTALKIDFHAEPRVETRRQSGGSALAVDDVSPVGVASAQKGSKGAKRGSGSYSSAPRGRHGWPLAGGHRDHDDWRDDHQDELRMVPATVAAAGVAYIGRDSRYEQDPPDAGPLPWDKQWQSPQDGTTKQVPLSEANPADSPREGWYRVGTKLVGEQSNADYGWQAADLEVDNEGNWLIDKAWHVRPRV